MYDMRQSSFYCHLFDAFSELDRHHAPRKVRQSFVVLSFERQGRRDKKIRLFVGPIKSKFLMDGKNWEYSLL